LLKFEQTHPQASDLRSLTAPEARGRKRGSSPSAFLPANMRL